ncbi:MAG: Hsp20/alpha crystallin family protein [Polyangiaceae bacterium]
MTNITVRNEPGKKLATTQSPTWDPFRVFRSMMQWDPFQEMAPLMAQERLEFFPNFDVKETKDQYVFKADMPGVKASDIDVSLSGSRLTISGKRESEREDKGDTYYTCERTYGSFQRSFTLPEGTNTNAVSAELKDGVFVVNIGKLPEVQTKKIPIGTPNTKS